MRIVSFFKIILRLDRIALCTIAIQCTHLGGALCTIAIQCTHLGGKIPLDVCFIHLLEIRLPGLQRKGFVPNIQPYPHGLQVLGVKPDSLVGIMLFTIPCFQDKTGQPEQVSKALH